MLHESRDDELDVEAKDLLGRDVSPGLHQHRYPQAKTIGVELFVCAWRASAPDVDVEDAPQLPGRGQRHELRAVLEAAGLNHPMQDFGLQLRDDLREVGRVQQPLEQGL